jgi:hypothetical protein
MGGVSPIDMQVMITKSVEVAKQYGQEIHKGVKAQQNAAEDEKRLQEESTKKVHDRNSSERIYGIDDEDGNGGTFDEEDEKKDETNSEKELEGNDVEEKKSYEGVVGHFDIKI